MTYIARIKGAVVATYENGVLKLAEGEQALCDEYAARVDTIIQSATYYSELAQELHRYYIFDEIRAVNLQKVSLHGIQGKRYLDLKEDFCPSLNEKMSMAEISEAIRGKNFT